MSWPGAAPPTDPSVYYASLTPEQQLANWQVWQQYQQQYAAWHAQYGEQYAKQLQGSTTAVSSNSYSSSFGYDAQPPLPPAANPIGPVPISNPPLPSQPPTEENSAPIPPEPGVSSNYGYGGFQKFAPPPNAAPAMPAGIRQPPQMYPQYTAPAVQTVQAPNLQQPPPPMSNAPNQEQSRQNNGNNQWNQNQRNRGNNRPANNRQQKQQWNQKNSRNSENSQMYNNGGPRNMERWNPPPDTEGNKQFDYHRNSSTGLCYFI